MSTTLNPDLRRALAERVRYCHEMGIYDFYQRSPRPSEAATIAAELDQDQTFQDLREEMPAKKSAVLAPVVDRNVLQVISHAEQSVTDPIAALKLIREDLG